MLFISTTHRPATDLGFLLHKNPSRVFTASLTFGKMHVAYPEATEDRTTAAVLLEIDPVKLVRGTGEAQGSIAQYVNDRPYVASSFLSVALAEAFGTAMGGRSKERQELADTPIPLEIRIPVLPCRVGESRIRSLFEPLGYRVQVTQLPLDEEFPDWGSSPYFDVTLAGNLQVQEVLRRLYVLLPVLDAKKHYYMDAQEVDKIVGKGKGWLPGHPERGWILRSSLGRKPSLLRAALEQLANAEEALGREDDAVDQAFIEPEEAEPEAKPTKVSLHRQRHDRIVELVRELAPKSLADLGCGEGRLIRLLLPIRGLDRILGMDVSYFDLERAVRKLKLEDTGPRMRERVQIIHGSLMYRDRRLDGFDVATAIEVVEHPDPPRLAAFERVVFEFPDFRHVLITTPNHEYNAVFRMSEELRHEDHRFEWTRAEFSQWSSRVAAKYGYTVRFEGIGPYHEEFGAPSQLAVFSR